MESTKRVRRSREGCWTCRNRRKKCDSTVFPCGNCQRLGLHCETAVKLVWEDDNRRVGMKRRGPPKKTATAGGSDDTNTQVIPSRSVKQRRGDTRADSPDQLSMVPFQDPMQALQLKFFEQVSQWPFELDFRETEMLNHYIQRFSRTYPSFATPDNPFLRVFMPLTMQSRTVLDAVLALSCVQSWKNGSFAMETQMLKYRHRALKGCMELTKSVMSGTDTQQQLSAASTAEEALQIMAEKASSLDINDIVHLLAICALLLLYEKLSGEAEENGSAHLHFFARLFPSRLLMSTTHKSLLYPENGHLNEGLRFISSLFLYNDLVRSTSLHTPTLSTFYLEKAPISTDAMPAQQLNLEGSDINRFDFPSMVARISSGDISVTDQEIAAWDGRLDWFPSFALDHSAKGRVYDRIPIENLDYVYDLSFRQLGFFTFFGDWSEHDIVTEMYRVAAAVYRRQQLLHFLRVSEDDTNIQNFGQSLEMGNLPSWAVDLLRLLPLDSSYGNTLLWPISIIAKELDTEEERSYILSRLHSLEQGLEMKHFHVMKDFLLQVWMSKDQGLESDLGGPVLFG